MILSGKEIVTKLGTDIIIDPFWGNKLMDKVAENILSAIENPEEAVLKRQEMN